LRLCNDEGEEGDIPQETGDAPQKLTKKKHLGPKGKKNRLGEEKGVEQ